VCVCVSNAFTSRVHSVGETCRVEIELATRVSGRHCCHLRRESRIGKQQRRSIAPSSAQSPHRDLPNASHSHATARNRTLRSPSTASLRIHRRGSRTALAVTRDAENEQIRTKRREGRNGTSEDVACINLTQAEKLRVETNRKQGPLDTRDF